MASGCVETSVITRPVTQRQILEEMNSLLMGVSAPNSLVKEVVIYLSYMHVKIDWSLVPEGESMFTWKAGKGIWIVLK
jgi:hypothetical protein